MKNDTILERSRMQRERINTPEKPRSLPTSQRTSRQWTFRCSALEDRSLRCHAEMAEAVPARLRLQPREKRRSSPVWLDGPLQHRRIQAPQQLLCHHQKSGLRSKDHKACWQGPQEASSPRCHKHGVRTGCSRPDPVAFCKTSKGGDCTASG